MELMIVVSSYFFFFFCKKKSIELLFAILISIGDNSDEDPGLCHNRSCEPNRYRYVPK